MLSLLSFLLAPLERGVMTTRPARRPAVIAFVGWSGAGKTTLVSQLIDRLTRGGLRVGALKHAHDFQMDREGKDTYRFRAAGAHAVAIASPRARAVITTTDGPTSLAELLATLPADLDVVLVEGYKGEDVTKIEVHRQGTRLLHEAEGIGGIVAIVTDDPTVPSPYRLAAGDLDTIERRVRDLIAPEREA